jgi:hypothetical protein
VSNDIVLTIIMKILLVVLLGVCAITFSGCSRRRDELAAGSFDDMVRRHRDGKNHLPNDIPIADDTGVFATVSAQGFVDLGNEFFLDLGANGRRCVSCHVPTAGWTLTPPELAAVFNATDGGVRADPFGLGAVFRTLDGANSPNADVSTLEKRRQAYSLLLHRGVIRIGLAMPANAEFDLIAVDDPYSFASAAQLSLYRRPLPTTNLKFDSTVMWDGREVVAGETVLQELETQASDATVIHAQGKPLTDAQRSSVAAFIVGLASAQTFDRAAGHLHEDGARGGPEEILAQPFYIGINDNFGDSKTGAPFNPVVFNLYDAWTCSCDRDGDARRAVARGQALFNTKSIAIVGVSGINDEPAFGTPDTLMGTCTTCHDTPNGGNHSVVLPLNIGLSDESRRTPDLPLYTFQNRTTKAILKLTDPGRGLIDGKWAHLGRFKGPMLRDLAARAPYFHNGFAADLAAVVNFYDERFNIGFSACEKADLVAFLRAL